MEYRHFDYQADSGRYRNKITAKLPWKFTPLENVAKMRIFLTGFTKLGIQPFVSDEIFASFGGTNQFNQNRFSSGLCMNLTKSIKAEIYYMLVSAKSSGIWVDSNVLGAKIKCAF